MFMSDLAFHVLFIDLPYFCVTQYNFSIRYCLPLPWDLGQSFVNDTTATCGIALAPCESSLRLHLTPCGQVTILMLAHDAGEGVQRRNEAESLTRMRVSAHGAVRLGHSYVILTDIWPTDGKGNVLLQVCERMIVYS